MPKKYPVEVRVFAVQKKAEGHSWDKVAEMIKQSFGIDSVPSRRQMVKWVARYSSPAVMMKEVNLRLPKYAPEWVASQQDALVGVLAEGMRGKDFGVLMAKWMFSQLKAVLGPQRLSTAWAEFAEEERRLERGSDTIGSGVVTPLPKEAVPEAKDTP